MENNSAQYRSELKTKILTSREIAEVVCGELIGDPEARVSAVASLFDARETDVSFLANKKYASTLDDTKASVILLPCELRLKPRPGKALILCKNPNIAFAKVTALFAPPAIVFPPGVAPTAVVSSSARIGNGVHIGANAVVEDRAVIGDGTIICAGVYIGHESRVGKNCLIYPNACVRERCIIGDRVIIHCGAVIGSDGFGFEAGPDGIVKIDQHGIVEIHDDVEIGANTTIDRARFGRTILKKGVKVDNLVQIAHNVIVGEFSMLIGQSGVAGSVRIGRGVILAAQGGISGHLTIGDGVKIAGQAGVTKDVPPGRDRVGTPAEEPRDFIERLSAPKKISKLGAIVASLEERIAELEKRLAASGK